ncbi:hypothetical protein C1I98_31580 [Spongiactinospora gelatinilytica]|uniref:CU044_5270 family protein n=1 Tax=Spongiactinospora gelatinilytica TaxID=2666298 RepID=A0A2W2G6R5_9ACTN|nr:CU044_5270 family protein [Spongiactinospora gelatinilytica]PZG29927.1 hypothetical protein C1I98_31580 [Spongiactinospora gelatinilytica]
MDDLNAVATLLAKPEPSAETIARSRGRLQDRMTPGRARRRRVRLLPALGMAAATAVAAAVIVTSVSPPAAAPVSGRDVLLMAAASAGHIPQGTGTYWHVTRTWQGLDTPLVQESWTARDGRHWSRNAQDSTPGAAVQDPDPFRLMGAEIGFEELEGLPSDPKELKERIAALPREDNAVLSADGQGELVSPLIALITELPTPAEVRSAAFEALAATPGVKNAGPVEGGQELVIPLSEGLEIKMVVDPETARVARATILLTAEGGAALSKSYISVTTDWTDELPQ